MAAILIYNRDITRKPNSKLLGDTSFETVQYTVGMPGICIHPLASKVCSGRPSNEGRAALVDSLLVALQLHKSYKLIPITPATAAELQRYHSLEYVSAVLKKGQSEKTLDKMGLIHDCPIFPGLDAYVKLVAGSTLSCARQLMSGQHQLCINWYGGRHHGKRSAASGFCYVNDVVLGIQEMRKQYQKIMYIDVDLHHGDAVSAAFLHSKNVLCVSLHHYDTGFFPGTGALSDCGSGPGEYHTANVPLRKGFGDQSLDRVFHSIVEGYYEAYQPTAVVLLLGCDGLATDEHKKWNLSVPGLGEIVRKVASWKKPTLVLGGGGYNHTDTARCWTYSTAVCSGMTKEEILALELPSKLSEKHLVQFETDGYTLWNDENLRGRTMVDENDDEYLKELESTHQERIGKLRPAIATE